MKKLDRKLLRDLSQIKGQAIAIVLVISAGIATFVMSMCAYESMKNGQETFYREYRFADIFATVKRCPRSIIPRIENIPGVASVEPRLVYDVLLIVEGMTEPAKARLISVPDSKSQKQNRIYISRGRNVQSGNRNEVVVSELFAETHDFQLGDQIDAIINGKVQKLQIVGFACSPEYVIQIQGGTILPDKKRFGVFWVSERELESAFGMSGAFNNVTLKTAHSADSDQIIEELDALLKPFGCFGAHDRSEQISHQFVNDELTQLKTMALLAPAIFLSVSAFLLNLVVTRIINRQREQVAALKAFGYSNREIGFHYLNLVMIICFCGVFVGTLFGFWMAKNLTVIYQQFYRFPDLSFEINRWSVFWALILTTLAGVSATWLSVRSAVVVPPAEAMRPEPPPRFRPTWMERLLPRRIAATELRMILRNVARKPWKSLLSVLGIAMAISVLVLGSFSLDALNYLIDFQFRKAQRQDITVVFVQPASAAVIYEVAGLDGVSDLEAIRAVAVRMRFQHRSRRIGLTGLESDPRLFRLLDERETPVSIPRHGLLLNTKLAELLGVQLGDTVEVEVLEGNQPDLKLEVTALISEFGGLNAYIRKPLLHRYLKESEIASGIFLKVEPHQRERIYQQLKIRPGVAGVSIKEATIESFLDTIAENMLTMRSFNILFAVVIAAGVVYNSARIALSEQQRDLATMRVIGFTQKEVSTVLLGEILLQTIAAIPLGCLIGYGLAAALVTGLDTENYRIPLIVSPSTFAFASLVVIIATLMSSFIVQRKVSQLNLVEVLKTRD